MQGWKRAVAATLGWGSTGLDRAINRLADARRLANFLRGHLSFVPRADDIYVATYPRSGTTWMQYTLHLMLRGTQAEFEHLSDVSPWYERSLAVGSMKAADFERFESPRILKTHLPRDWVPRAGRKIYIVRNGRDVAVSYFHFYRSQLGFTGEFPEFLELFLAGRLQYGSYFRHVERWRRHADDDDVLWLRYEDLSQDRIGTMRQVARFLHLEIDEPALRQVAEASDIVRMKAMESKFDHATVVLRERGLRPAGFIRSGRIGDAEAMFDAEQSRAFEAAASSTRADRAELHLASFLH